MDDYELLSMKFTKRFSTQELLSRLPRLKKRIAEMALLDINGRVLRKLVLQKRVLDHLRVLKKEYRKILRDEAVMILRDSGAPKSRF